jgi:cytochrome c-type biogenesis protein CcmF
MSLGQTVELAGAQVTLTSLQPVRGPNYTANQARFTVASRAGTRVLVSETRFYPSSQTETTQAGIGTGFLGNVYIAIGAQSGDGGLVVRMWDHPLVDWIWGGAFLMVLGGMASLSDRRFRLGATRTAFAGAVAEAAA